jgi:lambda family phage portal protein
LLDRAIAYVDPVRAARRLAARGFMAVAGGYLGARMDRPATREWLTRGQSADAALNPDLPLLRDRSRDLARNAPLAAGALVTVSENVIGRGLTLQARPDWKLLNMTVAEAKIWSSRVESEFLLFAEGMDCDLTRRQNFYGLQKLCFRAVLESGDVIVLLPMRQRSTSPYSLALQVIEADRLANPLGTLDGIPRSDGKIISSGVEVDADGCPQAYWILDRHPGGPQGMKAKAQRVPARSETLDRRLVLHLFECLRPGQVRGVPWFAPVIETIKQLDRYTEAEVMASVLSAMITVFVKSDTEEGMASMGAAAQTKAQKSSEVQLGTGGIIDLAPDEDIASFAPNRPNQAFEPFLLAVLRQIGVALGLPFEVLVKHFTASYSAARAALLEAWKFYRNRRIFLAAHFCQPVYESWMEEAILLGRVDAPGFFDDPAVRRAYLLSEWVGDAMPQIDPVKEVDAAAKRIEIEVSTLQDETMQLTGKDWEDVHEQRVEEIRLQKADGTLLPAPAAPVGGPGTPEPVPAPAGQQGASDLETGDLETAPMPGSSGATAHPSGYLRLEAEA